MYLLNVSIHVIAAFIWLGGMLFFGLVGAPVLRRIEPVELRRQLFQSLGMQFRTVAWVSIGLLLITGVLNLQFRGWLRWDGVLASSQFWSTPAGRALGVKLVAVLLMVALSALHDFRLGPAASRAASDARAAETFRRRAAWIGRINALLGVILIVAAVRLARS